MKTIKLLFALFITVLVFQKAANAQVTQGDTLAFWSPTYVDWPPLQGTPQDTIWGTCDAVGEHCYIFRQCGLPIILQPQIDTLVHRFDKHFVPELTAVYGPMPDALDNDSHAFIVIYDEPNWCGYWDPAQQMTDNMVFSTWGSHSSEHEIIYVASNCLNSAPDIVAHEFGHMLHWGQDHSPEPVSNPVKYWEDAWIDEGFSTFAAIYLTENIYTTGVPEGQAFFYSDPDIPLIYFSNYNQVKLWTLYMYEHYGWNYISSLISNQLNGIAGMDSTLRQINAPVTFNQAFVDFSIANYLDNESFEGGKYGYAHYTFNQCDTTNHISYPTGIINGTINPYGTDYICFSSGAPKPTQITFSGDSTSKFSLAAIKMSTPSNNITSVEYIVPDANSHAVINADSLGILYNKLILVVCNIDSSIHEGETASYSYFTTAITGIDENNSSQEVSIYPNPVKDALTISFSSIDKGVVEIFDMQGKVVYQASVNKKLSTIDVSVLQTGVYTLKVTTSKGNFSKKFTKE
jgi:hypothetical protein